MSIQRRDLAIFLSRVSFFSPRDKNLLFSEIKSLRSLLGKNVRDLSFMVGRSIRTDCWNPRKLLRDVRLNARWLEEKKGWAIVLGSAQYPPKLREIADPPIIIYGRGDRHTLAHPSVAIVGTRSPSKTGCDATEKIACLFASMDWNVVSGLAYGIDICAHRKIVSRKTKKYVDRNTVKSTFGSRKQNTSGGKAVAVLGTGIDAVYPKAHITYAQQILMSGGAILSELPPLSEELVRKHSFLARNRIISGLCDHVCIVQCPKKSGALATADFALEQGREVWVHSVGLEEGFEGTRALHRDGAAVIDTFVEQDMRRMYGTYK